MTHTVDLQVSVWWPGHFRNYTIAIAVKSRMCLAYITGSEDCVIKSRPLFELGVVQLLSVANTICVYSLQTSLFTKTP